MSLNKSTLLVAIAGLSLSVSVHATNGYFAHGFSVKEKAMAGAGVAYSVDALAAGTNPAGMVGQGDRQDIGGAIFSPRRSYTVEGNPSGSPGTFGLRPDSVDSENESFLIPQFGQNWMIDDGSAIGLSIYGNGGMNTEYKAAAPGTFGAGKTGVDLAQLFISTTYSEKISENVSWGISGILVYQTFEATGLDSFAGFSTDPENLSNNGSDSSTGIGLRLGIQGKVSPSITLGASYQPKIDMNEFDDYSGLFAEKGDFDIPSTLAVGLAWKISDARAFLVDFQQINYEDVAAVSNSSSLLGPGGCQSGVLSNCLGGANGGGFGWEDIAIIKLGYEWKTSDRWTWRFGFSTTDQPIPDGELLFNILAPGVVEDHFTFGFTNMIDENSEFSFAFMYASNVDLSGENTFDAPGAQTVEIEMDQYEIAASYSRRF